uniref:Uncharacterized protein n=1 Tax=Oryctolagus cuniculus TaxID=9986 RepID=A0A5F9D1T4_RABIT
MIFNQLTEMALLSLCCSHNSATQAKILTCVEKVEFSSTVFCDRCPYAMEADRSQNVYPVFPLIIKLHSCPKLKDLAFQTMTAHRSGVCNLKDLLKDMNQSSLAKQRLSISQSMLTELWVTPSIKNMSNFKSKKQKARK